MAETRGAAQDYYQDAGQGQYEPPPGPPPPQTRQYYTPGPPPPQSGGQYGNEKLDFQQTFKVERPRLNDWWAALLFLIVFAGFTAVSGIAIHGYATTKGSQGNGIYNGNNSLALNTSIVILFAFVLAIATVFSYSYVWAARLFPKFFIWVTGILNMIFGFVLAIWMLTRKDYAGGIIFLIFAAFTLFCFFTWIPRIPFSAFMLRTSIDVSKSYGHTYLVSFLGGMVGVAFAAWYSVTLVAIYVQFQPGNPACSNSIGSCGSGTVTGLIVFVTFAAYWISEVIKNVIHATIAGVYGSWFFSSYNMPRGATRGALKRSMTYSFGSISLGSLLVAIINFFRQLCSIAQSDAAGSGNIVASIMFCILQCFLSLLDWLVEFINRYAFVTIALYGKPYFAAARDTWSLIKNRGIDILVNLCLISPVLSLGAFFVGFSTGLFSYLYLIFTSPAFNANGTFTGVIIFFAFIIGLQLCNIFTTPLASGIDTIFVASAWDPEVLQSQHPEIYAQMLSVYPPLGQAISV